MDFLSLDRSSFEYGVPTEVAPGVRRIIAENPSKFTYHGTGTYLIGGGAFGGGVAVVDPGPKLDSHREALAAALDGETVTAILVTHCHSDHSPLAAWLKEHTGAPTIAYGPHADGADGELDLGSLPDDFGRPDPDDPDAQPIGDRSSEDPPLEEGHDTDFVPDVEARTGDIVATGTGADGTSWHVEAVFTPGHTSNHTCYLATVTPPDGAPPTTVLFPGDHVMGWSTTVVGPPDGDMVAYMASLREIAERPVDVALPTHGPPITDPQRYIGELIEHRLGREAQVLAAVGRGLDTIPTMVTEMYAATPKFLHRPAAASVLSHLVKLVREGQIVAPDGIRFDGRYLPAG